MFAKKRACLFANIDVNIIILLDYSFKLARTQKLMQFSEIRTKYTLKTFTYGFTICALIFLNVYSRIIGTFGTKLV